MKMNFHFGSSLAVIKRPLPFLAFSLGAHESIAFMSVPSVLCDKRILIALFRMDGTKECEIFLWENFIPCSNYYYPDHPLLADAEAFLLT